MTTDSDLITRAREEHLMAAFAVVLTHPAGFRIELDGDLWLESRDGQFHVRYAAAEADKTAKHIEVESFDDVREAINYFLDLRDLQLVADRSIKC